MKNCTGRKSLRKSVGKPFRTYSDSLVMEMFQRKPTSHQPNEEEKTKAHRGKDIPPSYFLALQFVQNFAHRRFGNFWCSICDAYAETTALHRWVADTENPWTPA